MHLVLTKRKLQRRGACDQGMDLFDKLRRNRTEIVLNDRTLLKYQRDHYSELCWLARKFRLTMTLRSDGRRSWVHFVYGAHAAVRHKDGTGSVLTLRSAFPQKMRKRLPDDVVVYFNTDADPSTNAFFNRAASSIVVRKRMPTTYAAAHALALEVCKHAV